MEIKGSKPFRGTNSYFLRLLTDQYRTFSPKTGPFATKPGTWNSSNSLTHRLVFQSSIAISRSRQDGSAALNRSYSSW